MKRGDCVAFLAMPAVLILLASAAFVAHPTILASADVPPDTNEARGSASAGRPKLNVADVVKIGGLIVGPTECPPGGTFIVTIPGGVEYTITPQPKAVIPLRDENGGRVLLIQQAAQPGYLFKIDQVTTRPTREAAEAAIAKFKDDKSGFLDWLDQNSSDSIFQDEHFVKVGKPEPDPEPDPDPDDEPAPIPVAGFRVLIIEESAERSKLPVGQLAIILGESTREYLKANCTREDDGGEAFRIYDQHTDVSDDYPVWKTAMERPRESLPWVIISNGKTGFEGPLPATPEEFISLCEKYEAK